ncbi:MAG: hypothetical protein WBP08_09080 [Saprospiraceae bacterium]|nr:hypothetical protein [Saprospiraceae bacterium]
MKQRLFAFTFIILFCQHLYSRDSITVYLFLLDECRICQEQAPEINNIYEKYGQTVGFLGLFPNFSSKKKGIESFKSKYGIKFSTKTDYFKTQVKKFEATVLPEVIVYNEDKEEIIYRGAINDLFYQPSKRRQVIRQNYLSDALQAAIIGEEPAIKATQPIGCFINFNDSLNN